MSLIAYLLAVKFLLEIGASCTDLFKPSKYGCLKASSAVNLSYGSSLSKPFNRDKVFLDIFPKYIFLN